MRKLSNFVIKYSIYGLVFLVPLFWLPFSVEPYEFNKQYLLVFLVSLAFSAWLFKLVAVRKKIVWRRTPLDIPILVLAVVMILAAVFSVDNISSWLGFYGRFTDSMVGLLALLLMYFVVVNNVSANREQRTENSNIDRWPSELMPEGYKSRKGEQSIRGKKKSVHCSLFTVHSLLNWFLVSAALAVLTAYFSIFNLWAKLPCLAGKLPTAMGSKTFNPTGGSLEGLAIFLAAVIGLVVGMILNGFRSEAPNRSLAPKRAPKRLSSLAMTVLLAASVILLVLIDFWPAWLALGGTMLILLVMAFWTRMFKERVNILILPILLIIISAAGLWINMRADFPELTLFQLPQEIILDYQTAKTVTWQAVKESPVLGAGPGAFFHNFTKFKPGEFNENIFWNIRFDKGPSHLMELLAATGLLGILSYLGVAGIFLLVIGISFRSEAPIRSLAPKSQKLTFLLTLLPWLSLFIAQFVYLSNTTLVFSFWLFTALAIVSWQQALGKRKKISFSFKDLPEVGLVMSTVLLILILAVLGMFYLGGRFYLADVFYRQGLNEVDFEKRLPYFEKAVNLNKYRFNYRTALSQVYVNGVWREAIKPEEERNVTLLQNYAAGAIDQAKQGTLLSSKLVSAWENAAAVYRDLRGLVGGTLVFASDSFKEALTLEPTNPFFYRELCWIGLMDEKSNWDEVLGQCQKAVDLKPNYLDAHIQLALVYERKGDLNGAIERLRGTLEKLKGVSFQRGSALAGAATEIYFQMGRLFFNVNNFDEAIRMFEQAVIITPQHANARYALALSYQTRGRNQEALIQFQIVNQLVPGNANVMAKIKELSQ